MSRSAQRRWTLLVSTTIATWTIVRRVRRRRLLRRARSATEDALAEATLSPVEWSDEDDDDADEDGGAVTPPVPVFRRWVGGDGGGGGGGDSEAEAAAEADGVTRVAPADARAAARWLAATHLGFLLAQHDEALRRAVLGRVVWRRHRDGAVVRERGEPRDVLILVVTGCAELYEAAAPTAEEEEDGDGEPARSPGRDARLPRSESSQIGLDLDASESATSLGTSLGARCRAPRERLASTLGPLEALGKFSVVVAAAAGAEAPPASGLRLVASGKRGVPTVTATLRAEDLRTLVLARPDALLRYARRTLSRLHRVAKFANAEFLRRSRDADGCDSAALPAASSRGMPLGAFSVRHAPGAIVPVDARSLTVLLEGDVLVGGARAEGNARRVRAPAVLNGFAFLDDFASDAQNVMAGNSGSDGGVLVAAVPEGAIGAMRGADAERVAEALLAVVGAMAPEVRAFGAAGMSRRWLRAGALLLERGSPTPNHFYVVISGRVRVTSYADGAPADEDASRGGVVGLCAVLTGAAFLDFDARCARDSELVAVPRAALEDARSGGLWLRKLAGSLGASARRRRAEERRDEVATVAVFGVDGPGADAAAADAAAVERAFEALDEGPVLAVGPALVAAKFGDPYSDARRAEAPALWRRRVASWLAECEERHRFVLLECGPRNGGRRSKRFLRAWARLALSQADKALVVADAATSRAVCPRALERRALYEARPAAIAKATVVLLAHDRGGAPPKRSGKWLRRRPSSACVGPRLLHFIKGDANDLGRAARIVAGRAVGVVLGGGGGRGLGHLGVLRALEEQGLKPDVIAGCSQGAFMAAAYALPASEGDRLEATRLAAAHVAHRLTSPPHLLWELTLPYVSFFSGYGFSSAVRYGLALAWTPPEGRRDASRYSSSDDDSGGDSDGDSDDSDGPADPWRRRGDERGRRRPARRARRFARRDVEDCWLPFFCVNTNLTKQRGDVRSSGDLVFAVRASMSVAELLPPARDPRTGDLLCDGCYVNNMPVHEMRSTGCAACVVGVSVVDSSGTEFADVVAYSEEGCSGFYLVLRRLLRFGRTVLGYAAAEKVPSMSKVNATLQVLRNKSQLADDLANETMDLFLEIDPVADFSASCYWQLTRVSQVALDHAAPLVRAFVEKRERLGRLRSASAAEFAHPSSLPALKSALFSSAHRGLSDESSSRDSGVDLLRRLSSAGNVALSPSRKQGSALHW